ncbi:MAG: hypothetical protein GTN57_04650, partial [Acidobacteria bacterium]|nr:hypothetical protein [Acidobacteriota bacterium]NIT10384.1 hypothetical protein [Acidobacteriota bacterium]
YDSTAQVGGRIASVGQRLLESSAKAIVKQSLEGLNQAMVRRAAAGGDAEASAPAPGSAAPSQAEFAASVAREVARDLVPAPVRWAGIILVVAAVVYALYALLT